MILLNELNLVVDGFKERLEENWDIVVAITGEEGVGKSTFSIQLAKKLDSKFDLEKNVSYLPNEEEVEFKFYEIRPKSVLLIDEAVKGFYKLNWQDKMQQRINQMYATERWQNKITLLLIPRFTDLNEFFRNHRVRFWFHIFKRGYGVMLSKDIINPFNPDPWFMKENFKAIDEFLKKRKSFNLKVEEIEKLYEKRIRNFVTFFTFEDLDEETKSKYLELKIKYREKESILKDEKRDNIIARMYYVIGLSQEEIAQLTGLAQSRISTILARIPEYKPKTRNTKKINIPLGVKTF